MAENEAESGIQKRLSRSRWIGIAAGAVAALLLAFALYDFELPKKLYFKFHAPEETPIVIGDGSIKLESTKVAWNDWEYYPSGPDKADALSWSARDDNGKIKGIKHRQGSATADCANSKHCAIVVVYDDGSIVALRSGKKDGKGMTLISSRPFGSYTADGQYTLSYGTTDQPKVVRAYVWMVDNQDVQSKVPICTGQPCSVDIEYK